MEEVDNLPEPLKHHSLGECCVWGVELPVSGTRLCEDCWRILRNIERERWLGEKGPVAIFFGVSFRNTAVGVVYTEKALSNNTFPVIPPKKKPLHLEWRWNPVTQQMEQIDDPPEEVVWLFWQDCKDGKTKSKVFWGMYEVMDYVGALQAQGHKVSKAGIKIFPIRRGE